MMPLIASSSNAIWTGVKSNSGTIEAIAAVLNLLLVIFFFFRERRDYSDRENARIQGEAYDKWYNLLVRERAIDALDDYYDSIEKIVSNNNSRNNQITFDYVDDIQRIKEIFAKNKRIFVPILSFFDENLKSSVWKRIQESHDQILIKYEEYALGNDSSKNKIFEIINETKTSTYKDLYEYDKTRLKESVNYKKRKKDISPS